MGDKWNGLGDELDSTQWVWIRKKGLQYVIRILLRTCKAVSRKPYINRESKSRRSQFSESITVVERIIKILEI